MPRRQLLMTAELRKALPKLYTNENKKLDEVVVLARFFHAYGQAEWFITEFDGVDTLFGYADLGMGCGEWGYMSLSELATQDQWRGVQAIERDICFKAKTWAEVEKERTGR